MMSGRATESTDQVPVVAVDIDSSLLRELVGDQGTFREVEMEDEV